MNITVIIIFVVLATFGVLAFFASFHSVEPNKLYIEHAFVLNKCYSIDKENHININGKKIEKDGCVYDTVIWNTFISHDCDVYIKCSFKDGSFVWTRFDANGNFIKDYGYGELLNEKALHSLGSPTSYIPKDEGYEVKVMF